MTERGPARATDQLKSGTMRGKWADGIEPRHFYWVIKDRFAICERPGGYGANHRPVRRLEEIIWIRQKGFDMVVSLIAAPHNLHNYEEESVRYMHRPLNHDERLGNRLAVVYTEIKSLLDTGAKVLLHHDELGDRIRGFTAGYLVWSRLVDSAPRAITVAEQITGKQMGPIGREIVAVAAGLDPDAIIPTISASELAEEDAAEQSELSDESE